MHLNLDCVPCVIQQCLHATRMATDDPAILHEIVHQVLKNLTEMDFERVTAPEIACQTHRIIRKRTGQDDPYRFIKRQSNQTALALLPDLSEKVRKSADPFATAVRIALAGNIIDFGVNHQTDISAGAIENIIAEAMTAPLDKVSLEALRNAASNAESILYICDNSGEIAFDRLLIEQLGPHKITAAVRGGPIINDAILEDAIAVGLTDLTTVITTGLDVPGTLPDQSTEPFRTLFKKAPVVISKGQGNYETLNEADRNIFFLLKAKCDVAAAAIGCKRGDYIVLESSRQASGPDGTANYSLSRKEA